MTTPPPLPPNEPTPPPPPRDQSNTARTSSSAPSPQPSAPVPGIRTRRTRTKAIGGVIVIVLLGLITFIALAASCPNERQMRDAVYGELGPGYKRALEWIGTVSKFVHGPHLVYHNHVIYSTLDFDKGGGNEIRLASGKVGKVELTSNVREVKDFILSIPGVEKFLPKQQP